MNPANDSAKPMPVYFAPVLEPLEQMNGKIRPQRVMLMKPDTAIIQVDSRLRKTGNDFDFLIDFLQSNASFRQIRLKRVMMPILPQINAANRQLTIRIGAIHTIDLPIGYYTPETFADMLNEQLGTLFVGEGKTVKVDYSPVTREITIDGMGSQFGIFDTCNYALYARSVCDFPTIAPSDPLTTDFITSKSMGMVFTRYVTISSSEMLRNQRGTSLIAGRGGVSLIGVIDVIGKYNVEQWAPQQLFPGTSASFKVDSSPIVNLRDSESVPRVIDFQFRDEYGFTLDRIGLLTPEYPTALWFEVFL